MRAIGKAFLCALAGAAGWLVTAHMFPTDAHDPRFLAAQTAFLFLMCGLIGCVAGLWQGWQRGSRVQMFWDAALGLVFGAVGGSIGFGIGGGLVSALFGAGVFDSAGFSVSQVIARTILFVPTGLFLGAAIGGTLRSLRGVLSGAVGGAIGGMIAGLTFDVIGNAVGPMIMLSRGMEGEQEIGIVSRGISAAMLGLGIGLFTAIFDKVSRVAWLRMEVGRNEGRDWPLDAAKTMIGRDERAQVPIFVDPQLPALAAVIERQGSQFILVDPGSPIGVGLNGFRLAQPTALKPEDLIQVGSVSLRFSMKGRAAQRSAPTPIAPVQQLQTQPTQPVSTPIPSLIVTNGPMAGMRFPLAAPLEIGREGADIRISYDAQASRRHARATWTGVVLQLEDLGSTNGTLVHNQRVSITSIRSGDSFQVGSTVFRVE